MHARNDFVLNVSLIKADLAALAAPLTQLLSLPKLKELKFRHSSARNIDSFAWALLKGYKGSKKVRKKVQFRIMT